MHPGWPHKAAMQKNKMTSIRSTPAIIQPAEGRRRIFIDPSYDFFGSNGLFNLNDPVLNRDDQLLPFHRMRQHMAGEGISVNTADFLFEIGDQDPRLSEYYSLGILDNYERVLSEKLAHLTAFVIMEPPVVAPATDIHCRASIQQSCGVYTGLFLTTTCWNPIGKLGTG
jgi:hypothetical protein